MSHRLLLAAHLLGTVALFSNFVATLFWQRRAARERQPAVVAFAFRTLNAGDLWITPLSVFLILSSGVGLALRGGFPLLGTGWLLWSTIAFFASGLLFAFGALPRQRQIARWTSAAPAEPFDWERYARDARRWAMPAHASLGLALLALFLMLAKPSLPAL